MNNIINKFLAAHPVPWAAVAQEDALITIEDVNRNVVDFDLDESFSDFIVSFVNTRVGGESSAAIVTQLQDTCDAVLMDFRRVVNERDAYRDELTTTAQSASVMRDEMSELHDIIEAQRALIDSLHRRLSRKEAQA